MLQFIVLGEIPGTQFVMTFSWILAIVGVLLLCGEISIMASRNKQQKKSDLDSSSL